MKTGFTIWPISVYEYSLIMVTFKLLTKFLATCVYFINTVLIKLVGFIHPSYKKGSNPDRTV